MKRLCLYVLVIFSLLCQAEAQRSFSDSLEVFQRQVISSLQSLGTEPANKVAFDFQNAWTGKFTTGQQKLIHSIALRMQKKGYTFNPYFWYYFSYLAYSTTQANLNNTQLSEVLAINDQVIGTMTGRDYKNFLLGLNMFMARRIIGNSTNVTTVTDAGSFEFKLLDEYVAPVEEEMPEEDPVESEETLSEDVESDPWAGTDDGATDDPWASDPWGEQNSDPWGDDAADPWGDDTSGGESGSYDDNWVESENTWGFDEVGEMYEAPQERKFVETIEQDYVGALKSMYLHPDLEGPAIVLENNSMVIVTPYDSFLIKETDGTFLLQDRIYAGERAVINWPSANKTMAGAVVNLNQFKMRKDRSDFWTPHATLTFPALFSGTIEGAFEFRSQRRRDGTLSDYPIFTSHEANIKLFLPGSRLQYAGGIELRGNQLVGRAVSKKQGRLEILDGNGNKAVFRSEKFQFNADSTITSTRASLAIIHGTDSLFHPAIDLKYDARTEELIVFRTKEFNVTPFFSTYFDVNIYAELIKWDMETDSLDFSIINGKDMIPVTIESKDFFSKVRFDQLAAGLQFHPVVTSVYYANMFGTREFVDMELAEHFKVNIKQVKGAMKILERYGFADYDPETGLVQLKDKAYLYHDASAKKVDFDNFRIPSLSASKPNASWRLDSGYMVVNGVDRFYFTTDFKVYAEPVNKSLRLEKGRNVTFDGMVEGGDFSYKGKDFQFDYDAFLIKLDQIDSIRIQIETPDSLKAEGAGPEKSALANHLNQTTGTLYLNYPDNKSGLEPSETYPEFLSESEAIVYFDGPEVLYGAYDKSVKFIIPPFDADSTGSSSSISFEGRFNSGGIFPTFEETLRLMPDQSLGFVHQIPSKGYNLYGTAAKTYEKITLSNEGIRGGGKIDFITSTLHSKDFIYYPDSVAAIGQKGVIGAGEVNGASYPEAVLTDYRMHWLPRVDSMYLKNLRRPFEFYNATATLDGEVNITSKGVYGSGKMLTRGSQAISDEMTFKEFSYSARHAEFEVLTDDPEKPAMAGDDISLNFDLNKNIADIHPEKEGVAAISFPYARMKTSITNAIWYLEDSVVTMTKPPNAPIERSYFYTTRKELDSLAFNAEQAVYDFNTKELNIKGIPFIRVADALIIPEGNETTILENSELQPFHNAQLILDTLNQYHYLHSGEIKVLSRNAFTGTAMYRLISGEDTFAVKFDHFELTEVPVSEGKKERMTVSGGEVFDNDNLLVAPGFFYKGNVTMYAKKPALELDGYVKLKLADPAYDYWVKYERNNDQTDVRITIENTTFEDQEPVISGLHYDLHGEIYTSFVENRKTPSDEDFFLSKGLLSYDTTSETYKIETPAKTSGESYSGYTMIYDDSTKNIVFEGPVNFFGQFAENVSVKAAVLGTGNRETGEYAIDAFLGINFPNANSYMELMANDLLDIVERLGPPLANDISIELLYKLANYTSNASAKVYETASLKDYTPLYSTSEELLSSLVVSGVKMNWSSEHKAWYNTTKLAISNIYKRDVNAKLDGFIEIKKDNAGNDVLNLFIQAAPGTWYFIGYSAGTLLMYSSNSAFNGEVNAKSNYGKAKPGEMVLVGGDENETLSFINDFREKYFGITEPYNLVYPEEINLEDETFETIEEEPDPVTNDDDGFGF